MDENTLPEDPLGPPLLPQHPAVAARTEALAGSHGRRDGLGTLTTWPTINPHPRGS